MRAFARNKAVTWTHRQEEAAAALVERWTRDTAEQPDVSRFVFAYMNKDIDRLNAELRQVRCDRGEHRFETRHGELAFAVVTASRQLACSLDRVPVQRRQCVVTFVRKPPSLKLIGHSDWNDFLIQLEIGGQFA